MRQLEVFFDYTCPFCLRGHEYLVQLLPGQADIEIVWRPCEAHPRPEQYGQHSDLCIQGLFFAQDNGADIWAYHERLYSAVHKKHIDIENVDALVDCVKGLLDAKAFRDALACGVYAKKLLEFNDYAYEHSGVWALPSYRMNGKKLDSIEGIGITKQQLASFMNPASV